ncbi:MAG TPA: O-antigen ligase family protein [Geminicoccaceae bacterium]|nr:O-antigen ligase family protein [Geminicoccaceae bacterium]
MLAPLPFAGQHPLAWSLLALLVGALLLLWATAAALDRHEISSLTPRLWPLLALFALAPLWTALQVGAWTPRDWHSPLWQLARLALPEVSGRITIDPHASGTAAMRLLTYGGVFWLAFQHGRSVAFARVLIKALAAAGLGYAAYGLYIYASGLELVLWLPRPCCRGDLTSTFVNRNHYAPYAGIGLLCALGLILTTLPRDTSALGRAGARPSPLATLARSWWRALAAALLAMAVVLSHSRGGLLATVLGLTTLMLTLGAVGVAGRRTLQVCAVLVALGVGATMYLVDQRTIHRFDDLLDDLQVAGQVADEAPGALRPHHLRRLDVYERVWQALAVAPLTGTGFGTFADAFRWHQGAVGGVFDYAHNSYLEAAMELGVPVACALLAAVGGAVGRCLQGLRERRRHRLYPALAIAAAVLLGSHALFDFSVQIPAVAITFAALLGTGCAQSFRQVRRAGRRHRSPAEAAGG